MSPSIRILKKILFGINHSASTNICRYALMLVLLFTIVFKSNSQSFVLHSENGVTLKYSYNIYTEFGSSGYGSYDTYTVTVYLENNSGRNIEIRDVGTDHYNYYRLAKIGPSTYMSLGEPKALINWGYWGSVVNNGTTAKATYKIMVVKGTAFPKPDFKMDFKFVESNLQEQWSDWNEGNCHEKISFRYKTKELYNLNYQFHIYFEVKSRYRETTYFTLSLKDKFGKERFGTRRNVGAGQTIEFIEKMDGNYITNMSFQKVCFKKDDGKEALCDDEIEKANANQPSGNGNINTNTYNNYPKIIPNTQPQTQPPPIYQASPQASVQPPAKPLTPAEIKQQQEFTRLITEQQQLAEKNQQLMIKQQEQRQLQLLEQQRLEQQRLEEQRQRQQNLQANNAAANQLNQNLIRGAQNAPIQTFSLQKTEIKEVKQQSANSLDKGSVSGITISGNTTMEISEFSNFETKNAAFTDSSYNNNFEKYLLEKTQRPLVKNGIPQKGVVNITFAITEKGLAENIDITSNNEFYITPVTNAILLTQGKWKPATKGGTPFRQKIFFKVQFE